LIKASFLIISSFIILFLSACGYKPTSYYSKNEISGYVFVKLIIDIDNTTNSVLVKDAVNEMIVNEFGAKLTYDKSKANTIMDVALGDVTYATLQSDNSGFAKLYRTNVDINLKYKNIATNISKSLNVSGSYDYSVDADSVITESKKLESVKIASQKALSNIFSKIAVRSFEKIDKQDKEVLKSKSKDKNDTAPKKSKSFFFFN